VAGNKFKLYENKNSLSKKYSRMLNGGTVEIVGDKYGWWERRDMEKDVAGDIKVTINEIFHKKPHLVSYYYYQTPTLFWLILQYNNIVDIDEEFIRGRVITVPEKYRALTELAGNNVQIR